MSLQKGRYFCVGQERTSSQTERKIWRENRNGEGDWGKTFFGGRV